MSLFNSQLFLYNCLISWLLLLFFHHHSLFINWTSPSPASPPFLFSSRLDSKLYKYDDGNNTILYIILYHPDLDHKPSLTKYKIPKPFLPPLPQLPPSQYPMTTQQKMVELLRIRDDRRGFSGQPLKVTFWVFFYKSFRTRDLSNREDKQMNIP